MSLFISAGEPSGDAYGAFLLRKILERDPSVTCHAVGGPRLAAAGANLVADSRTWGVLGVVQSIKACPRIWVGYLRTKKFLRSQPPGVLVAIDFGYLNIRLARFAKALGWKVVYFIPPGSWRRDRQGTDLPKIADAIATPFPWSADILRGMGANVHWFGHPLKELVEASRASNVRLPNRIALLPGSREHEVLANLRVIGPAIAPLDGYEFEVALVNDSYRDVVKEALEAHVSADRLHYAVADTHGVLRRSHAAIVCSGTATLEAALCGCPTVVVYRFTPMMELEARILRPKYDYISLPNILLQRGVLPELIQHDASPRAIREHLVALLDGSERAKQLAAMDELQGILGPSDAVSRTADLVLEHLR
ncbi:MAG: lipid-A-disaccharide synthase [Chthonomonas sp.]